MDFKNKANNNALDQTPVSLHKSGESISGFTKGHHFEIRSRQCDRGSVKVTKITLIS